jgi:hypothetical protein
LGSFEENEKLALLDCVRAGGELVIVAVGATVSTVQLYEAGDGSVCRKKSLAWTSNVCCPWLRPLYVKGLSQALKPPPSRLQSNVAISLAENWNVALVELLRLGGLESMEVSGGNRMSARAAGAHATARANALTKNASAVRPLLCESRPCVPAISRSRPTSCRRDPDDG